jgi:hypothetical protein
MIYIYRKAGKVFCFSGAFWKLGYLKNTSVNNFYPVPIEP